MSDCLPENGKGKINTSTDFDKNSWTAALHQLQLYVSTRGTTVLQINLFIDRSASQTLLKYYTRATTPNPRESCRHAYEIALLNSKFATKKAPSPVSYFFHSHREATILPISPVIFRDRIKCAVDESPFHNAPGAK